MSVWASCTSCASLSCLSPTAQTFDVKGGSDLAQVGQATYDSCVTQTTSSTLATQGQTYTFSPTTTGAPMKHCCRCCCCRHLAQAGTHTDHNYLLCVCPVTPASLFKLIMHLAYVTIHFIPAGNYYFVSTQPGDCAAGLKLEITVISSLPAPAPAPTPAPVPAPAVSRGQRV